MADMPDYIMHGGQADCPKRKEETSDYPHLADLASYTFLWTSEYAGNFLAKCLRWHVPSKSLLFVDFGVSLPHFPQNGRPSTQQNQTLFVCTIIQVMSVSHLCCVVRQMCCASCTQSHSDAPLSDCTRNEEHSLKSVHSYKSREHISRPHTVVKVGHTSHHIAPFFPTCHNFS